MQPSDSFFFLYTLTVEVVGSPSTFACGHELGVAFTVHGEDIRWVQPRFSQFALASLLPLLPAKQRELAAADWMLTDTEVACPDPQCGARFRIIRGDRERYEHADVTRVPMS